MRNKERKRGNQKREQDQKKGKKENGKYETEIEREKQREWEIAKVIQRKYKDIQKNRVHCLHPLESRRLKKLFQAISISLSSFLLFFHLFLFLAYLRNERPLDDETNNEAKLICFVFLFLHFLFRSFFHGIFGVSFSI